MSGSDILFTTVHVISDWPISDHMNLDLTQRSRTVICVTLCPPDTDRSTARSQGAQPGNGCGGTFRIVPQQCSRPAVYWHAPDWKRL
ncbi:unnamed protein product, partial [Staurois parvus]